MIWSSRVRLYRKVGLAGEMAMHMIQRKVGSISRMCGDWHA